MKKLIVALVMCLSSVAFAQSQGVQVKKCHGVIVTPQEAADFRANYDLSILTTMQILSPQELQKLIPDSVQTPVVAFLKRFDAASKSGSLACVEASNEDMVLALETMVKMSDLMRQSRKGQDAYVQLLQMFTDGNKKRALAMIDNFVHVVQRMSKSVEAAQTL